MTLRCLLPSFVFGVEGSISHPMLRPMGDYMSFIAFAMSLVYLHGRSSSSLIPYTPLITFYWNLSSLKCVRMFAGSTDTRVMHNGLAVMKLRVWS